MLNISCLLSDNRNNPKELLKGILITQFVVLAYNLIFFNRYFSVTEGWFSVYAEQIRRGLVPYIDFHFILPPLYPATIALFINIFGGDLIYLRVMGIVLMLILSLFTFLLMSRLFPAYIASIVTVAGVIYYQAGTAHITYDFIQFFTTYVLISTYFVCLYYSSSSTLKEGDRRLKGFSYLIIAGFFCSMALLIKQSNGIVLLFILTSTVLLIDIKKDILHQIKSTGAFLAGASLPLSVLFFWLYRNGALSAFINQTLIGASKSKGSILPILIGWIPRIIYLDQIAKFLFVSIVVYSLGYRYFICSINFEELHGKLRIDPSRSIWVFLTIMGFALLAIFLPLSGVELSRQITENQYFIFVFYSIIITVLLCSFIFMALYIVSLFFQQALALYNVDVFIISMTSLGFLLGTATSGGIAEAGSFLGFSMILGYLIYLNSAYRFGNYFFIAIAFLLIIFCASRKYTAPYSWWWIKEPDIRKAVFKSQLPELRGFYLSEDTVKVIQGVTGIIKKYPVPGDDIFTFPNIPLFYFLTNKLPDRFIFIHWYDVLPDDLAIKEAERIIAAPPKIIVYLKLKEEVALGHELLFRGGKQSGQRAIIKSIEWLTGEGGYSLEGSHSVPDGNTMEVWILKDFGT